MKILVLLKTLIGILLISVLVVGVIFSSSYLVLKSNKTAEPVVEKINTNTKFGFVKTLAETRVVLSPFHVGFDVPNYLEINGPHDANSFINLGEVSAKDLDTKNAGVTVTYSIRKPWTPNIDNIPFANAFGGTGKLKQLDSKVLVNNGSVLNPDQVIMYTYLSGDAEGHNRGKLGSVHEGDVRVDFETSNHLITSEAVFFKCIDNTTGSNISKKCADILNTFLSSLRVESAHVISSPPSLENPNYFSSIGFKKRNFDPKENLLPDFFTNGAPLFTYFDATRDAELVDKKDDDLKVLKCMSQQIYVNATGFPYYPEENSGDVYTIRTTDSNNLFHEERVVDPVLISLIKNLKDFNLKDNYKLDHFFACQKDDGSYVVKYNRLDLSDYSPSTTPIQNKPIIAVVATVSKNGNVKKIAEIKLPKGPVFCERPLALTSNDIFYFECNSVEQMPGGIDNTSYIYRVDLESSSYKLLSFCRYYYPNEISKSTMSCY